ncbi:MAG: PKD domain-containing protein, partial [Methanospirillum sp.]|nr:PKD domain-containing protein [Methanospirillum sp.]
AMDKNPAVTELVGALLISAVLVAGIGILMVEVSSQPRPIEKSAGDFHLIIDPLRTGAKISITHNRGDNFRVFKDGVNADIFQSFRILVDGVEWPVNNSGEAGSFSLLKGRQGPEFQDYYTVGDTLEAVYGDTRPKRVSFIEKKPDGSEFLLWGYGGRSIPGFLETGLTVDFYAIPRVACAGDAIQFFDASTNEPGPYYWEFGDGGTSSAQNPSHTYSPTGTYTVRLTAGIPSLTAEKQHYISIQQVVPNFYGTPVFGTEPLRVQFHEVLKCGTGTPYWEFGDGNTSGEKNPLKDAYYAKDDKVTRYTVTYTVTQGNTSYPVTKSNYITVCPNLVADFSVSSDGGPAPLKVIFTDHTKGDPGRWQWNFGDGATSSLQNPVHIYTAPGDYTVILVSSNACEQDMQTATITVPVPPPGHIIRATAGTGGNINPGGNVSVEDGGNQTFTITPDDCYRIADLLVDNVSTGPMPSYTFTSVDRDHTIHAIFSGLSYLITPGAGSGGTISPSTPVLVSCGGSRAFISTANPCYAISGININGILTVPSDNPNTTIFQNVHDNQTIFSTFRQIVPTITASAGPGGNISPSGIVPVLCGNEQPFTITANTCYNISDIIIDSQSAGPGSSPNTTVFRNVTTNHTISAQFSPQVYLINATAGVGGTINPSGDVIVPCRTDRTFTVTAYPCYRIADVVVDGTSLGAQTSPYSYTFTRVVAPHTLSASFEHLGPFSINASVYYLAPGFIYYPAPAGTITPSPPCLNPCTVPCGNSQGYTIVSSISVGGNTYDLAEVVVDGSPLGIRTSYSFANIQGEHTIIAYYAPVCNFASGTVVDATTRQPIGNARVDLYNRQRTQLLWHSFTRSDGTYQIPVMLFNGDKYDMSIANNTPAWKTIRSHLYYIGQDAGWDTGATRDDIVLNPGGKCKTFLDWEGTR